jgi:MoaA/NifB/PqqE/SkfB family radical SAM enzyme
LNIEVTRKCNLECTFCWHGELKEEDKFHMSFELFKKIIDEATLYHMPAVNLNGLGEPMMHPRLIEMIEYCRDAGIEDIMFHTNGTIMPNDRAENLIKSGLTQIIFSLDTPDKDLYESMRIKANFDKVNSNVNKFISIRNKLGLDVPYVRVTMVLTDKTVDQVPEFNKKWKDSVDLVTVQDLLFSYDTDTSDDKSLEYKSKEKSYYKIDKSMILDFEKRSGKGFRCPYLYQSLKIHNDGSIDACSPKQAPYIGDMGDTILKAWNGSVINKIRGLHESGKWRDVKECCNCDIPYIELHKIMISTKFD